MKWGVRMFGEWEKSKIELRYIDAANETFVGQTINNVKPNPTGEEVEQFSTALDSLSGLPLGYVLVSQTHRYEK